MLMPCVKGAMLLGMVHFGLCMRGLFRDICRKLEQTNDLFCRGYPCLVISGNKLRARMAITRHQPNEDTSNPT